MTKEYFLKYILVPILGFGIAGALWGYEVFLGEVGDPKPLGTPFGYIFGALFLGILGSGSLVLFSGNWKKILQMIGVGTVAWIVAFNLPRIWEYPLSIYGGLIFVFIFAPIGNILDFGYFGLRPSLGLANFWIEFFLAGAIVSALYYFVLKTKAKRTVLSGTFGFAIASIVSPIAGNIIGNTLNSLFMAYLVTFGLIGTIFGASFVWGLHKNADTS